MRFIVIAALAALAAWVYRSERAREWLRHNLAPLQPGLRRAMTEMESAAEQAGRTQPPERKRVATLQVQELPDGTWLGDANGGGRTFHEGATEVEPLVRRLAAHLAALPEADRSDRVKLIRVSRAGEREEREQDLAGLLG